MTAKMIEVINPTARAASLGLEIAPRVHDLNGKVIGLLDNSKTNFDIFLSRVEDLLSERFKLAEVVRARKSAGGAGAALPFAADEMEKFAAKCDVVVNGMGD